MLNLNIINQSLPAGIEGLGYEFFYSVMKKDIGCTHDGKTLYWNDIPKGGASKLIESLKNNPVAQECLKDMKLPTFEAELKQYAFCRFGKFDAKPDVDENGNIHEGEFFDCGLRGMCKYEGKLCTTIKLKNGELTKREVEVLKEVGKLKLNKEIASDLFMSTHTVSSHIQNIQQKGGFARKTDIIFFAKEENLI